MKIRFAKEEDIEQIIELCEAHAAFEKANYNKTGKAELLFDHLFNQDGPMKCLVLTEQSKVLGYATFMKQFSTWEMANYLYLDCLFIDKDFRSQGAGKKIMAKIKEISIEWNCGWMEWQTPDFNKKAIGFYHKIGAKSKSKERFCWT